MLTFRRARKTPADEAILTEFIAGLWTEARAWTPRALLGDAGTMTPNEYVSRHLLATDAHHVVIASAERSVVGMGCLKMEDGNRATIIDVYVAPEHRNNGNGSSIIRHLETVAAENGIAFIDMEVASGNRARNLYFRRGYQPFTMTMRKALKLPYAPDQAKEVVRFSFPDRSVVQQAYERHAKELKALLPFATIEHIGASSIPGALSKGDLDIGVAVKQEYFKASRAMLAERFERNHTSAYSDTFASFKCDLIDPPLGIQLYVQGSTFDRFTQFRELLASKPDALADYNELKRSCEGMSMGRYRELKNEFICRLLATADEAGQQGTQPDAIGAG